MSRGHLMVLLLAVWAAGSGCVSYTSQPTKTEEVVSESDKVLEVGAALHGHILRVGARSVWTQSFRVTTEYEASYEFESFLGDDADTWWFYVCVSPVILPIDLVQFTFSLPFALIDHATDLDESYEGSRDLSEPLAGLGVQVTAKGWTAQATTDEGGDAQLDVSEAAALALQAGELLTYRWQAEGQVEHTAKLNLGETFLAARGRCGPSPRERHTFWLALAAKSPSGRIRTALETQAEWISPSTLERYRQAESLHPALTLTELALYRDQARILRSAGPSNHLTASNALTELARIVARVDSAAGERLALRSIRRSAEYVVKDYYGDGPVTAHPTRSLVVFCEARLPLAQRLADSAALKVFSTVIALGSNWNSVTRSTSQDQPDWVVAFVDRAATAVEVRRAQEARAKAEAERRAAEAKRQAAEDAFHYRYLTGTPQGYSAGSSSSSGSSYSGNSSTPSAPRQSEYQRMQSWRRDYEWKQARTNRAFNQHR